MCVCVRVCDQERILEPSLDINPVSKLSDYKGSLKNKKYITVMVSE